MRPEVFIANYDCRDALPTIPDGSIDCVMTSPPYWNLRKYGTPGEIGQEPNVEGYVAELVTLFREIHRVLADDGTAWLNLGDSYRRKNLQMVPARVALALQADGWFLRSETIWEKPNALPDTATDRPGVSTERVYLLTKSSSYFYDWDAVAVPCVTNRGGNVSKKTKTAQNLGGASKARVYTDTAGVRGLRDVLRIPTANFRGAHTAVMPTKLAETCVLAGCRPGGAVLDPFGGSGTTGLAAARNGRNAYLVEANPEFAALAQERLVGELGMLATVTLDSPDLDKRAAA